MEVKVDGHPSSVQEQQPKKEEPQHGHSKKDEASSVRILVELRMTNGLHISETTPYLREALNYLDKFWNNIFAFLKDGNLPIDNNLAERAIRPLTTQRRSALPLVISKNSILHFGSDEGAEMAATYHSLSLIHI